jgi:hypothetical protein
MATALITASTLALASLVGAMFLGYTSSSGSDVLQHTTWSTFATLIVMLSHCLTMFYLIGKGRAVKDAALEANLSGEFAEAIARARKPVFSIGMIAIALTMATAVLGAGVDTRVLPVAVHSFLALAAVAANVFALRAEVQALASSARVAAQVNRLMGF